MTNDLRVPRSRAAFTLVELLVVIAIIGILVWRALASRAGGEVLPE